MSEMPMWIIIVLFVFWGCYSYVLNNSQAIFSKIISMIKSFFKRGL